MYYFSFGEELENADIISNAIYASGGGGAANEPLNRLFKYGNFSSVGNQGGIRKAMKHNRNLKEEAFVILLNTKKKSDWPNEYDPHTKILTYYGDNETPGKDIHGTKQKGNVLLKKFMI